MALSEKLRKYLMSATAQELLQQDDVTKFLLNSFTLTESDTYKELIEFLMSKYDDIFGEINILTAGMFRDIIGVGNVSLNGTVDTIPSQCFENAQLGTIEGNNVTIISAKAFYNCNSLRSIDFPKLEIIGSGAFTGCAQLSKVDLPKTIKRVGMRAFKDCPNLKQIHYHGTMEEVKKVLWGTAWDGSFDCSNIKIVCTDGELCGNE